MTWTRRSLLAALATAALPVPLAAAQARTRLILLGTAGGPRPRKRRSGNAQAIVAGGNIYVIDCGDGVARQMALAGLSLRQLRHIFITHHHSDHNIDMGALVQLAWMSGRVSRIDCWGPPPTEAMMRDYLKYQSYDVRIRTADEGRVPLAPLVHANDIRRDGLVLRDEHLTVTAAAVPHPPLDRAYAYRFDARDRSIVISGDTVRSDALVALARGADVLVHEVMLADRVHEMLRPLPNREQLARSVISHHTTAEEVGAVAAAAGVKQLVLSHFVPAEDPEVPDEEWLAPVRKHYRGPVVVGRDLMEI